MTIIRTLGDFARQASAALAVCTFAMATSCAPTDGDASESNHPQPRDAVSIGDQEDVSSETNDADESVDKEIKNHYCCAEKKGNRVKSCFNMYIGFVNASLSCRTTLTDNALRDGICTDYPSCTGKTRNKPHPQGPEFPNGAFEK